MIVPSPRTWATGDLWTAGIGNQIRDTIRFLMNPPYVVIGGTGQSFVNNIGANISFTSAYVNTDSMWSAGAPDRLTIQTPGMYSVKAYLVWPNNGTGERKTYIGVTGTFAGTYMVHGNAVSTPDNMGQAIALDFSFVAGDIIQLGAFQNSGSALAPFYYQLSAVRISS